MDFIEEIEQSTRQDLKRKFCPQIYDVESTWADITKLKRLAIINQIPTSRRGKTICKMV